MATYRVPVLQDFAWQPPVADRVTAPAGSETKGTRYLVIATGSGVFTGKENHIMTANQDNPTLIGHWIDDTPVEGWTTWVKDENIWYIYDGAAWNIQSVAAVQSQVLVLESEMSAVSGHVLTLEGFQASATSALSVLSANIAAVESDLLVEKSTVNAVSEALVLTESDLLVEKSTVNAVSEAVVAVDSQLLIIESEVAAAESDLLVEKSTVNAVSEALVATNSRVLVLESEMSQAESELLTKQSEAVYTAAYGCLEFEI